MNKTFIIITTILIIFSLFLSGCAECKENADCSEGKICKEGKCVEKPFIPNICGNGECETGENKCTCLVDCGVCSGKAKLIVRGREVDAKYLEQDCVDNKCVYTVKKEKVQSKTIIDEPRLERGLLELKIITKYNSPFKIDKDLSKRDGFDVAFKIKNIRDDFVPPFKITNVRFVEGENLFGEKDTNILLRKIGEEVTINVPSSADLKTPEEEIRLEIRFDYVAKKRTDLGVEEIRETYKNRFGESIYMLETGEEVK